MKKLNLRTSIREIALTAFCSMVLIVTGASASMAATFTVTNTNDSGPGSLRQAITDANGGAVDIITFNIAGTGVHKIAPLTELPDIIGGALIIDGTTQPGWTVGNLVIEISGENIAASSARGLQFLSIPASAPQSIIRGLTINRFAESGIYIQDSQNITVEGCFIGTDATGTIDRGNNKGIYIKFGSTFTQNITIGGTTAAARNVISGNDFIGIDIFGGNDFFIKGNYLGTDKTGSTALPNGTAIQVFAVDTTIGGSTAAEGNVISGNRGRAVLLESSATNFQNNYIGVAANGVTPLGNGGVGVDVFNPINLVTIGNHLISGNIIANNLDTGINVRPFNTQPTSVRITANSIYNNQNGFTAPELGIDLNDDGATPNDTGDPDTGPNNLQNFPVLTSAAVGVAGTNIHGTLNSQPNSSYRIEFFANDTDMPEGKNYLGFQNIATNASGNASFNSTVSGYAYFGQFVTATATRNTAPFDTSELSTPIPATFVTLVVTNTNDSGTGSLRQAILDANTSADPNVIEFAISPTTSNVKTISPSSALPVITAPVSINGLSQAFSSCAGPKIELDGSGAGASTDGLTASSTKVLIQGLAINRFGGDGISLLTSDRSTLKCLLIGTNSAGSAGSANGGNGIILSNTDLSLVEQNTLSGNGLSGVRILNSNNNIVRNNVIGLDKRELSIIANIASGIVVNGNSQGNLIGGPASGQGNTISGNTGSGITLSGSLVVGNLVKGNAIGVNSGDSVTTLGNAGPGILIASSSSDNTIGGSETGAGNVIASNHGQGVFVSSSTSDGNRIFQNSIHDNDDLGIDLGTAGVTANDTNDIDTGANGQQNFPLVSAAESFFGGLTVTGSLNSSANTAYRVEVYSSPGCDASGNGEGRNFLGAIDVVTSGNNVSFSGTFPTAVPVGQSVTATATRVSSTTDTSEFSVCRTVTALVVSSSVTVTNTNDSGTGSLRQAIINANSDADLDQIVFNIPGSGIKTIAPTTALPNITAPVIIDGLSQSGATCSAPVIELNGNATSNADGLHISGSGSIRGLIINRFDGDGVEFDTVGNNVVKCNWIGVDNTGLNSAGNGLEGVFFNRVSNNTVGSNGEGNVITSNNIRNLSVVADGGIELFLSNNNLIQGNIIGLDKNGQKGNITVGQNFGISMLNADNNLIGGTTPADRNVISFDDIGIRLANSDQNQIQGNYIGIDSNGGVGGGLNGGRGVYIDGTSIENVVGGAVSGTGNVISNNSISGVEVSGSSTQNQVIQGNLIGTNPSGTNAVGSQQVGIAVNFAPSVSIGGRNAFSRNIISGNTGSGVVIDNGNQGEATFNTVVEGNYLGLSADGVTPISGHGNGALRIVNGANSNNIGGSAAGAGNVIAGNVGFGVSINTKNNVVQGNRIGTDASGTLAKPNGGGIVVSSSAASNNLIGGATTAGRNIVSGNTGLGINLTGGSTSSLVYNNFIGVNASGTSALGNGTGISISGSNGNYIGNSTATGNVISGNLLRGITFVDADGNFVQGNLIGSNAAGNADLGNGDDGIEFQTLLPLSTGNTIGGPSTSQRNVISGNARSGINLDFAAQNTTVQNNLIGTGADGSTPIGNSESGITIFGSSNTIGGLGVGNTIAFNGSSGVTVPNNQSNIGGTGNRISANSIFSNNGLGIDLGPTGVTLNDAGDIDLRGNNQQNFPVLTSVGTQVQGSLNSLPNASYSIEFYLGSAVDPSGYGEGTAYIGTITVTTNASGNANFSFIPSVVLPSGSFVTATATDASGNTSEFSLALQQAGPTAAEVSINGRIVTPAGRYVSRSQIRLHMPDGTVRSTISNQFGYFRFLGLPVGTNYVIEFSDKSHTFEQSSRVITLNDAIDDLVVIATPRDRSDIPTLTEVSPQVPTDRPLTKAVLPAKIPDRD